MASNNNKKKTPLEFGKVANRYGVPAVLAIGLIPLIMRTYTYDTGLAQFDWYSAVNTQAVDIFLAYKSWALMAMIVIFGYMLFKRVFQDYETLSWEKPLICIAIYGAMVLISGIASKYPGMAFKGAYEMFESVGAVIGYLFIFYYCYTYVKDEGNLRWLIKWTAVFIAMMLILGFLQGIGMDPFRQDFGKMLITTTEWWDHLDSLSIDRAVGIAYLTLYNENFLSMYFGVLIPIMISLIFAAKKPVFKVVAGVFLVLSIFVLYHGGSSSGWLGLLGSAGIMFLVFMSRKPATAKIAFILAAVVLVGGIFSYIFIEPFKQKINDTLYIGDNNPLTEYARGVEENIQDIHTKDGEVVFYFKNGKELHTTFVITEQGIFVPSFWDENQTPYEAAIVDPTNMQYQILDTETFGTVTAVLSAMEDGTYVALYNVDGCDWPFTNQIDNTFYYLNALNRLVKLKGRPGRVELFNYEFMSMRGIIWDYCLARLPKHMILGCGSNLFLTDYPQDDYIHKTYHGGRSTFMYDVKAHSFYFQQWMENGFIAFMALMIFFAWYIIRSIKIYRRADFSDFMSVVGFGAFAGCLAFMIVVIANDSNVCSSPVFWGAFGVSCAINREVSEKLGLPEPEFFWKKFGKKQAAEKK